MLLNANFNIYKYILKIKTVNMLIHNKLIWMNIENCIYKFVLWRDGKHLEKKLTIKINLPYVVWYIYINNIKYLQFSKFSCHTIGHILSIWRLIKMYKL